MAFLWPASLGLLFIVAALIGVYVIAQRRRLRYALRYASQSLVRQALDSGPGRRRHIPSVFFFLGFAVLVVALARPQAVVKVPGLEGTVILTLDVSGSMLADDVKPNRFEAMKDAAKAFVERQREAKNQVRVGVVSFSDDAQMVMAPTLDRDAVIEAIDRLKTQKSTAIGRAINVSLDSLFRQTNKLPSPSASPGASPVPSASPPRPDASPDPSEFASTAIVLLTDGENNIAPNPLGVLDVAVQRGIRIYTVGVGTPQGTIINDKGRTINTELDEGTLKQIAETTHAKYFNAQTEKDLQQIYTTLATQLILSNEQTEITILFVAAATALLLAAGALSLVWFHRMP